MPLTCVGYVLCSLSKELSLVKQQFLTPYYSLHVKVLWLVVFFSSSSCDGALSFLQVAPEGNSPFTYVIVDNET